MKNLKINDTIARNIFIVSYFILFYNSRKKLFTLRKLRKHGFIHYLYWHINTVWFFIVTATKDSRNFIQDWDKLWISKQISFKRTRKTFKKLCMQVQWHMTHLIPYFCYKSIFDFTGTSCICFADFKRTFCSKFIHIKYIVRSKRVLSSR